MAKPAVKGSLVAVGLAGALCALAVQAAGEAKYVVDGSKAASLESCVESTDFMRRNHMEVIKHQRDATVRGGIRSTKHSLADCFECHVSFDGGEQPIPVNAEGQFCYSCHDYAAVTVNCFGCHATVPRGAVWSELAGDTHPGVAAVSPIEAQPGEGN